MTGVQVTEAQERHLEEVAAIYGRAVLETPATFDLEPQTIDWWRAVLAAGDPRRGRFLLVALDGGEVIGFAKSGQFRERAAYASTCEVSVYVAEAARGSGVGTALYRGLLERLERSPLRLAVAGMTEPNPASRALHLGLGFELVGTFTGVGVKFGRAWDVTWYQRRLDVGDAGSR